MKFNVEFKNFAADAKIRRRIEQLTKKVDRKLTTFSPDEVFLRLLIEENPVRKLYRVSITLGVPGKTLATQEQRHDLDETIRDAFAEIDRQIEAHKATLRGEPMRKRRATTGTAQTTMKDTQSEKQNREKFFSLAGQHLERLYEFVRHRLAYFESLGDLAPGELAAEDVVDAVLLRAYHEYVNPSRDSGLSLSKVERVKEPAGRDLLSWLIEFATERLRSEVKRLKSERNRKVRIEEDIPDTPPIEEVSTLGDEILDFYQPDEDLKLEDIFPDVEISTPEEMTAAKEELLRCVNASLAAMPKEWRRALRLRHAEGFTDAELADALHKAAPEIERILEYGRQHLRESLIESGCTFIAKASEGPPGRERS